MKPITKNYRARNNADWHSALQFKSNGIPVDLTNRTFNMMLRDKSDVVIDFSSYITVSAPETGIINIDVPASIMNTLEPKIYKHDIQIRLFGSIDVVIEGNFILDKGASNV